MEAVTEVDYGNCQWDRCDDCPVTQLHDEREQFGAAEVIGRAIRTLSKKPGSHTDLELTRICRQAVGGRGNPKISTLALNAMVMKREGKCKVTEQ